MDSLGRKCPHHHEPPIGSNLILAKANGFTFDCQSIESNSIAIPPLSTTQQQSSKAYDEDEMRELIRGSQMRFGTTSLFCGRRMRRGKKLLVLDLNGVLVDIICNVPPGYKPDKKIRRKAVFKRPSCDDFLRFCFERFDVGVWSSKVKKNVDDLVDFLMGEMKHHLLFCWDRSHCTETGLQTIENRHKPLVLKELRKLWYKQEPNLPWENGDYDLSNTLLLDDSPYKALCNPLHTAVFPDTYTFKDKNDNSLGPGGDLRVYLEGLHMAENVQEYVEQHPFGQQFITNMNPSWAFYNNIVGIDNFKDMHISSNWFQRQSVEASPCQTDFSSKLV